VETLGELFDRDEYKKCHCIGIDEAQFFSDLRESVIQMVEKDQKIVFVAGLTGTYQRTLFGDLYRLVPLADHIITLQAVCADCADGKTPGIFTKRLEVQGVYSDQVGGKNVYKPVCRQHYHALT